MKTTADIRHGARKALFLAMVTLCAIGTAEVNVCHVDPREESLRIVQRELYSQVDGYICSVAPASRLSAGNLVDRCMERSVDICFVLAQGHVESHFGTEGMARWTNSPWNVGAGDHGVYDRIHHVYRYEHPDSAVTPYLDLLGRSYLIRGRTEQDLMRSYTTPGGKRYATSTDYEGKIRRRYGRLTETTEIRMLQARLTELTAARDTTGTFPSTNEIGQ